MLEEVQDTVPKLEVLIVDDEIFNLMALSMQLNIATDSRVNIVQEFSGESCIQRLEERKAAGQAFDFVFIDYQMPGLTGVQVRLALTNYPRLISGLRNEALSLPTPSSF